MTRNQRNPRNANGSRRRSLRRWLRSLGRPCWICREFGRPGEIDYSLPARHPMAFEMDELVPVSLGGDPLDPSNVDATHRACNEWRSNMTVEQVRAIARDARSGKRAKPRVPSAASRDWRRPL
ncbi:endonuclease [Bifidobacterium sp.]|uniref:endonuclease n=1 Tax=Bifidobacterium sp. TaxID=41200 RepID=UPI00386BBC4F